MTTGEGSTARTAGVRRLLATTRGGVSVARTAATLRAAPLRTFALVQPRRLDRVSRLAATLAALQARPTADALAAVLDRLASDPAPDGTPRGRLPGEAASGSRPAPGRPATSTRRPPTSSGATLPTGLPEMPRPAAATKLDAATTSSAASPRVPGGARPAGRFLPSFGATNGTPVSGPDRAPGAAAVASGHPRGSRPTYGAAVANPAARRDPKVPWAAPPPKSDGSPLPTGDPGASVTAAAIVPLALAHPTRTRPAETTQGVTSTTSIDASGALAEIVGRWQSPASAVTSAVEPAGMPAVTTAATPAGTPVESPFASLAATGILASYEGLSSNSIDDDAAVDLVERALDEVLRREVEQHGLDRGAW